ncbi:MULTISPECIES: hypothetical protein [Luteibacter]|uniref:hypothetical protein n=1 Tax=Luteibacter TaxID=242605 RepID=UPI00055C2A01|nr:MULTISPECIES: hypothetical protein [unclassified Luteibacter]
MVTATNTTILKDGTTVTWTAEYRIDGENVVLEWIRARTPDNEWNVHWQVGSTIFKAVEGGEVTGALRASIDDKIESKHAERPLDRRQR